MQINNFQEVDDPVLSAADLGFVTIDQTVAKFKLNVKQEFAVRIVLDHFTKLMAGENPLQLLMAVLGEPGVGKSVVAAAIAWHFAQHSATEQIVITAFTGRVTMSFFKIGFYD